MTTPGDRDSGLDACALILATLRSDREGIAAVLANCGDLVPIIGDLASIAAAMATRLTASGNYGTADELVADMCRGIATQEPRE